MLNGVKVLSMLWVIFGHSNLNRILYVRNTMDIPFILTNVGLPTLVVGGYFAVDVFFWMGGMLMALALLPRLQGPFLKLYPKAVLHRLVRIWPAYFIAILFFWQIMPLMGDGPVFKFIMEPNVQSCNAGRLLNNLFFIDNFRDHSQFYCFNWGWYLSVDFQLFLVTPPLLFVYKHNKKWGAGLVVAMLAGSLLSAWLIVYLNDWFFPVMSPNYIPSLQYFDQFYYRPYVRASPYLVGILMGMLHF